ncbi:MAG: carboxylesterase, partial [Shinella sp. 65-6]
IPVRRYCPARVRSQMRLFYIHGGGFVVGSLDSHDAICAEISEAAGAELVSVDYRLSPEHVWPAAFDDCWAVLVELLLENRPVVVIGDSAGGNLAAGIVLKARDEGLKGIAGQALVYPGLGGDLVSGSYAAMAEAPGLSTADVAYYREVYKAPEDAAHAFPLRAENLAGLPPAFITGAYFDPLRDDARAYAARLILSGVPVEYREERQMIHAWLRARFMSEGARAGFAALCDAVRRMAGP